MTTTIAIVLGSPIILTLAVWIFLRLTHDEPNLDELAFEARELPVEPPGDPEDHKAFGTMGVRR